MIRLVSADRFLVSFSEHHVSVRLTLDLSTIFQGWDEHTLRGCFFRLVNMSVFFANFLPRADWFPESPSSPLSLLQSGRLSNMAGESALPRLHSGFNAHRNTRMVVYPLLTRSRISCYVVFYERNWAVKVKLFKSVLFFACDIVYLPCFFPKIKHKNGTFQNILTHNKFSQIMF